MSIAEISLVHSASPFRVAVPGRLAHPTHRTFVRRRLAVGVVLLALALVPAVAVTAFATDRGGAPAPAATIRPSNVAASAAPAATYVVRPGDTLWSIAQVYQGSSSRSSYVEALIQANGGASILVGQRLVLP
jgi:hypothetical protein